MTFFVLEISENGRTYNKCLRIAVPQAIISKEGDRETCNFNN